MPRPAAIIIIRNCEKSSKYSYGGGLKSFLMLYVVASASKRQGDCPTEPSRGRGNHQAWGRENGPIVNNRYTTTTATTTTFIKYALLRHHSMIYRCRLRLRLDLPRQLTAASAAGNAVLIADQSLIVANYLRGRNCKTDTAQRTQKGIF